MKKNANKGFSLVELIIVIAIMAILIGVLAPTYMKYVEKTRVSRDASGTDSICSAIENAMIDWAATHTGGTTAAFTLSSTGISYTISDSDLSTDVNETVAANSYKLASSKTSNPSLTCTLSGGVITWSGTVPSAQQYNELATRLGSSVTKN